MNYQHSMWISYRSFHFCHDKPAAAAREREMEKVFLLHQNMIKSDTNSYLHNVALTCWKNKEHTNDLTGSVCLEDFSSVLAKMGKIF